MINCFKKKNNIIPKNILYYFKEIKKIKQKYSNFSLEELKKVNINIKKQYQKKNNLHCLIPDIFSFIKEINKRILKLDPFDSQILGGLSLYKSNIIEMKTGEGKTLVVTFPVYLNYIKGYSNTYCNY